MISATLTGYPRPDGRVGCRNHLLVLPSVVCAGLAAEAIAGGQATAIVHQHGCDHVGDDAEQARRVFTGMAANPNVAASLVLGLGCETIQGKPVAAAVTASSRRAEYLEIQACGGSASAIRAGKATLSRLTNEAGKARREPVPVAGMTLGVAIGTSGSPPAAVVALADRVRAAGASLILAVPGSEPPSASPLGQLTRVSYGERPSDPVAVMHHCGTGAEQHTGLAAGGAQVIVSWRGPREAPLGFPLCPVISVASDQRTYQALADDFDLDGVTLSSDELADQIWSRAERVFNGELTASEHRGAREFALHRTSRST